MHEVEYLELDDLIDLVRLLQAGPVRDLGLLDGAALRPRSSAFGADAYPTVGVKAAALLHSIARNHPLVDGNKRLAWLAAVVFLDLNDLTPRLGDDEAFELVMDVAMGLDDLDVITTRLALEPSSPQL